jgi:hypothetical protein
MKNTNPETLLKTDKAIFYYVWQEMKKQAAKSVETWFDEESGEEMPGDDNRYFGWSTQNDHAARCAIGFIMNRGVAEYYDVEDKDALDIDVIATVISSNPEWEFSKSSAELLMLLQIIHDRYPVESWDAAFSYYENNFDSNGKFMLLNLESIKDIEESTSQAEINLADKTVVVTIPARCKIAKKINEDIDAALLKNTLAKVGNQVVAEQEKEMV